MKIYYFSICSEIHIVDPLSKIVPSVGLRILLVNKIHVKIVNDHLNCGTQDWKNYACYKLKLFARLKGTILSVTWSRPYFQILGGHVHQDSNIHDFMVNILNLDISRNHAN